MSVPKPSDSQAKALEDLKKVTDTYIAKNKPAFSRVGFVIPGAEKKFNAMKKVEVMLNAYNTFAKENNPTNIRDSLFKVNGAISVAMDQIGKTAPEYNALEKIRVELTQYHSVLRSDVMAKSKKASAESSISSSPPSVDMVPASVKASSTATPTSTPPSTPPITPRSISTAAQSISINESAPPSRPSTPPSVSDTSILAASMSAVTNKLESYQKTAPNNKEGTTAHQITVAADTGKAKVAKESVVSSVTPILPKQIDTASSTFKASAVEGFPIEKIYTDIELAIAFRKFAKSEFSTENIDFIMSVNKLPKDPSQESMKRIYDKFIKKGASSYINLSSTNFTACAPDEKGQFKLESLKAAQTEIQGLMGDTKKRFIKSPFYKEYESAQANKATEKVTEERERPKF